MAKVRGSRTAKSYLSDDPDKRLKQLANLTQSKGGYKFLVEEKKKLKDVNIIEFATDKDFLGLSFKERKPQEVILRVLYGLPLDKEQKEIFKILTKGKGKNIPGQVKDEAVLALGARSGKSFIASICALYEATRDSYKQYLSKGEFAYIVIVATRELQARKIIQENCLRMLENSPILKKLIKKSTDLEITLKNNVKIISGPCNSTALRGLPIAVLILDEIAFYRIEGPKADETIFNSLRPRQAQFPNNKLFLISTAGAKQGLFFNFFNEGFKIQDRLTCQAPTSFMNPLIPQKFLEKERARDIDNFMREFEAIFAEKVEAFLALELIRNSLKFVGDLEPKNKNKYQAGIDQSGLSGRDRFSFAISHREGEKILVDCARSWDTKNFKIILKDIEELKNKYDLKLVLIDQYAKAYVSQALKEIGLIAEIRPSLAEVFTNLKSLALMECLFLPASREVEQSLQNTIAFYGKNNRLSISHERSVTYGHGDLADAVATSVYATSKISGKPERRGGVFYRNMPVKKVEKPKEEKKDKKPIILTPRTNKGKVFFGDQ